MHQDEPELRRWGFPAAVVALALALLWVLTAGGAVQQIREQDGSSKDDPEQDATRSYLTLHSDGYRSVVAYMTDRYNGGRKVECVSKHGGGPEHGSRRLRLP